MPPEGEEQRDAGHRVRNQQRQIDECRDNGVPGERPVYHPGYVGAFVLDPDGNNVEAVNHNR